MNARNIFNNRWLRRFTGCSIDFSLYEAVKSRVIKKETLGLFSFTKKSIRGMINSKIDCIEMLRLEYKGTG